MQGRDVVEGMEWGEETAMALGAATVKEAVAGRVAGPGLGRGLATGMEEAPVADWEEETVMEKGKVPVPGEGSGEGWVAVPAPVPVAGVDWATVPGVDSEGARGVGRGLGVAKGED